MVLKNVALTFAVAASAVVASAAEHEIPPEKMKAIYEEVKTPCKVGMALVPEDGEMLDNPMVFRKGDSWYMMFIRFDGKGYETHLAESKDLRTWKRLGCIFSRGAAGQWDSAQADGWPALVDTRWEGPNTLNTFDGRYWMMYLGGSAHGYETDPLSTGVAWTDDPSALRQWTRYEGNPVLSPSDPDVRAFEKKTIYKHFTVEDPSRSCGGRFVNFYNGKAVGKWQEAIGMAVSDDMLHWRRVGDGPVVVNGNRGISGDPFIKRIGDVWVMFYFGCGWGDVKGAFDTFACSRDLRHWTKWTGEPLIKPSESYDNLYAHKPWVLKHNGVVYHWYCAVSKRPDGRTVRGIALATSEPPGIVLFDAASAEASTLSAQNGASFSLADGLLTVNTPPSDQYPGVCVSGKWDLSRCGHIEVEFVNGGINGQYTLRLLNPGGNPGRQKGSKVFKLPIKLEKHAVIGADMVSRNPQLDAIAERLKPLRVWALPYAAGVPYEMYKGRHSAPQSGIGQLDPKDVVQVAVYINQPKLPHTWSVKRIVAKEGAAPSVAGAAQAWTKLSEKDFFPYIDQYGQFRHKDWPDKVHSDADFARQREKEEKDLAAHPGPKGWDKWGGWADGPQLPKTGGFSTTKWKGKWWIVDPDGHLWWSHGPVRVLPSSAMTPLATPDGDRAGWFEKLPKRDDPVFGEFYETRDELLWPYYTKRGITSVYDFSAANIRRKYGEKWFETWADLAHRRLRSWSCNTIANSSDKRICLMDRTPYTERFEIHARPIAGHKGGWWEFCDPFDPSFRAEARRMTEVYRAEIEDPWCMGFFVDNEHYWGSAHSFGLSTLKSPADQPCKAVFRDRMKAKYGTVAKLNAAWNTSYKDWDDFLRVTKEPKSFKGAKADLEAFSSEIAETYFRIIREELKRANPGKLYLGCRWAQTAPAFTVRAAAKYCDVISYNVYRKEMSGFKLPDGIDAPVMIGEFHFGALDRGPFCPGLILLRDQKHRAETYKEYVRTSLEHPQIVGVHWHQFSDQATSGRFDGENMQVGWTDVCDTPYWGTVEAVREIGSKMYEIRAGIFGIMSAK